MGRKSRCRSAAYLCLAVVVLAALLPGLAVEDWMVPEPTCVVLPDLAPRVLSAHRGRVDPVQPPTRAPRDGRAPPSSSAPLV